MATTLDAPGRGTRRARAPHPAPAVQAPTKKYRLAAAGFLSPALVLIAAFVVLPMVLTLWISLHRWSMFTPITDMEFVGLDNYRAVVASSTHMAAVRNTVVYVGLSAAVTIPLALLLALLLYFPQLRGRGVVRVLLFATYVVPTVAIVIIWSNVYAPGYGPLDNLLALVGVDSPGWLSNPDAALYSLVIFNVWQMLGYYVVLLVAGLTQIPEEVYEAARIDGAGPVRQTVSITVPLLRGALVFVLLMAVINSIQVFDPVYLLTQGGPVDATNVLSFDIQRTAFQNGLAGEASAMAFSLLVLLAAVAGILGAVRRRA
ncbi:carbohydrate ABC transporter permease [Georgenia sp. AZ-5]|uniref:carbohydrate ABC transporter permease n=1 Tax=Georgenia sp. AZ-5 TaxID=3367526 RepID=UPI0037553E98